MGVVVSQTFKNTIYTYIGYAIGAVNTLFLYINFLSDEYFGLVSYLLSTATIMMPLLTFGVQNSLVKFFSSYSNNLTQEKRFTTFMLILPLFVIIPVGFIGFLGYKVIVQFLTGQSEIVEQYVWIIYLLAVFMAYFEVFFAWTKVHMKSVSGNFLKEIFSRLVTMVLLFLVYLKVISVHEFIIGLAWMYLSRMLLMGFIAYKVKKPVFEFSLPNNVKDVLKYSSLIILAGSIAVILLDVDKFMIGQYLTIENVAFYNVAVFIAMVIIVPSRAMHQITYPMTAKLLNEKNMKELAILYKKSSITLYIVSGIIFLLIIVNINELYKIIPEQYSGGLTVVLLISLAKLSENIVGNNNSIIFNSNYYRMILFFGVILAIITIILNMLFIPLWGITGAAIATLTAFLIYNSLKVYFVWIKFNIHPFSKSTLFTTLTIISLSLSFYFWEFGFHPVINIILKSTLLSILFLFIIIRFNFSSDITNTLQNFINKKNNKH